MPERFDIANSARGSADHLLRLVYAELRQLASTSLSRERRDHTLQPTALVHEAYLRLMGQGDVKWESKGHFLAIAATMMRRVLVDHARAHRAAKRGGVRGEVELGSIEPAVPGADELLVEGVDVERLDAALAELSRLDERQARVVELRFFGGLDVPVVAEILGVSERTVKGDWRVARAWLRTRLDAPPRCPAGE